VSESAAGPAKCQLDVDSEDIVGRWAAYDLANAIHPSDREIIPTTGAARALVAELFTSSTDGRDLFSACARIGRLMAEAGASPSLAAITVDNLARVLAEAGAEPNVERQRTARAALFEGYVAALSDTASEAQLAAWDYPASVVPLGNDAVAVACSVPTEDHEALSRWATRIASRLAKGKIRSVVVSGRESAIAELRSALDLVGIDVPSAEQGPRWRWPWSK
jgi:hypothetical protein